jgi:hypothetical protein
MAATTCHAEMVLEIRLEPIAGQPTGPTLVVKDEFSGAILEGRNEQRDWLYALKFSEDALVRRLRVSLTKDGAGSSEFPSFLVDPPFFYQGRLRLVFSLPQTVDTGSDSVRALWSTNVRSMTVDQLIAFHQRAGAIARTRIKRLANDWDSLHPYDVRAAFKYLESAVVLSHELYVIPEDDVREARDWMANAIGNAGDVTGKAVGGLATAEQMIAEIDSEEGNRFSALWREILKASDCKIRRPQLEAYKQLYLNLPSNQRRQRLVSVTGVSTAHIESAITQCISEAARQAIRSDNPAERTLATREVEQHIEDLKAAEAEAVLQGRRGEINQLQRDIIGVENILRRL